MSKYKVEVNDDCIGCGACVGVCGEEFELVDGKSKPINGATDSDCVMEAKDACPVSAISVEEN